MLKQEYDRLGMNDQHRRGCQILMERLDIGVLLNSDVTMHDKNGAGNDGVPLHNELELNPVFSIKKILSGINSHDSERVRISIFCQAISLMPIFHYRIRREIHASSEFWSPLVETLQQFINRSPDTPLRLYHDPDPNPPQDIIYAAVLGIMNGD